MSAAITGLAAARSLAIPLFPALLLGAVPVPTDPAVLIPLFRQVREGERLAQTVVAESALNDATGARFAGRLVPLVGQGLFPAYDDQLRYQFTPVAADVGPSVVW